MPNKRTFQIKPIKELMSKYCHPKDWCCAIDPFPFEYERDATDYLNELTDGFCWIGFFDPPYSPRQLKECYKNKGEYDTKSSTWSKWKDLMTRKIKVGGRVISFGWNTNGLGKSRGFEIIEILLVAHGGMHNDTIVTVEEKIK